MKRILVTGAAGFIGHHMARYLKNKGNLVIGADWETPKYGMNDFDQFLHIDLRYSENCSKAMKEIDEVYHFAADMGGMGFIQAPENQYKILWNNTMINFNTMDAARKNEIKKFLFSSSACIYPNYLQKEIQIKPLKEEDAYPADPQDTYGWEKLQMEHLCKVSDLDIRIVRFHNIYGPEGAWEGGREKAPAALCRKIIEAKYNGKNYIEMWGDGKQTRSFCYIDDCIKGLELVMNGSNNKPVNLGRDDLISINDLAKLIMKTAGIDLKIKHIRGPEGVRGRNSDNTLFRKLYGWEPEISMEQGLEKTYNWIEKQILKKNFF